MGISFGISARSEHPPMHVFDTVTDLRSWDDYVGVRLTGPRRALVVGDRIDIVVPAVGRNVGCTCAVESVRPPHVDGGGSIVLRTVDGSIEGRVIGAVNATHDGSELEMVIDGRVRGALRLIERPLELVLRHWSSHQLEHLLQACAR